MSLKQCQRTIDAQEFAEWLIYSQLEPWGEWRSDLRAGIIASVMANTQRGKDTPAYSPADFMPKFHQAEEDDKDEDASIALTQALFESLTTRLGGEVIG